MTLTVHRSNDLEALVGALAELPPLAPPDPFEPETIVLQTRGMERWLSMRLAEARGIFAHGRFVAFDELLDALMDALVPAERAAHWKPGQLVWRIAEVLRHAPSDPELGALAAWLASAGGGERDAADDAPDDAADEATTAAPGGAGLSDAIVQLAWRIAEVFHRYALHRPAMVDGWERDDDGADVADAGDEGRAGTSADTWQRALWRRLAKDIGAPHPGRRLASLVAALAEAELPASLPRRIVLFGHHTLARVHVAALAALGRRREVHLFQPAVGAGLGGDPHVVKHPLRASLGRLLDHMDALLVELAPDAARPPTLREPKATTLLARVQRALYHGPAYEALGPLAPDDASLAFHACASPLRQVEVLRDELLALFSADPTLEPRDVIVMTPNMETYAPLIDAVFRDGDKDLPKDNVLSAGFPPIHRLHDLSLRRTNPIAESFLAILDLAGTRYALSAMLDLLALPPVLAKVGLLEEELGRVAELVREAQIRWGRDEHHRVAEGLPATRRNTWAGGFDRLLLGHALATIGVDDFMGIVPVDDVEGKDETRTLGLFVDYLERLFDELAEIDRARTVPEWRTRLAALTTNLLVHDDASAGQAQPVFDVLDEIVQRAELGGFTGALTLGAMRGLLAEPLEARRPSVSFLSGGLAFCTLLPMRTIPFRVVCLLGMDDGEFPRSPHGLGFDLLEGGRLEPGDRTAREDDRMTFLETLMAAKEHLLVTWTGYRATDKRELDASGPVAELLESVRRGLDLAEADALPAPLFVRHPLQPFSPANFEPPPQSFDRRYLRGAKKILGARTPPPPQWDGTLPASAGEPFASVALDKLVASFEDPSKWFCRERLRVSLGERDVTLEDREPLALNALELWGLRNQVLGWELDAVDADDRMRALEATGVLPFGAAGRLVLRQVEDEVRQIAEGVRLLRDAAWRKHLDAQRRPPSPPPAHPDPVVVSLRLGGVDLTGQLDFVYGDERIAHQAGKVRAKGIVALWVRHLALAATMRRPVTSHLVGQGSHVELRALAPWRARELLFDLVELHLGAHRRPLPLFPATAWAWLKDTSGQRLDPNDVPKRARDDWKRRGFDGDDIGDGTEPHAALLFGHLVDGDFPFDDTRFLDSAERVFGPLFATPELAWTAFADARIFREDEQ